MSKHFEAKKETLSIINKAYSLKKHPVNIDEEHRVLQKKYAELLERTKSLEKVYQFHKGVIQNISSGILTIDFDEKITFINTAALRVLGYNYKEIQGRSIRDIFAEPDQANEILHDLLKNKKMFESREVNLLTRSNKVIPIGFTTTILNASGETYQGIIISFRDLSTIIDLRNQMERIDRLTTLGEVSAGIAHEIRNPLAGIKTSAQVLEESFSPNDPRSQLVQRIVKEIDRSNELLKKFFKFAKPGKPKQEFISLHPIIEGVYILLTSKMSKKGIEFVREYSENLPDVYVDENQLEQVIMNLFLNAMDAIRADGKVTVKTGLAAFDGDQNECVILEIGDTGCGIKDENLEKIFNPFYTTKTDGVGLGLSISSRLIEENGGVIKAESEFGSGTKFIIELPTK
jgi:two-component system, NtrC family, sensor histidine kinase AtoS